MDVRVFISKKNEITSLRKLYEELHNLHSSPNGIRMIRSRRMRYAEYVANMGEKRETDTTFCQKKS
jgi:hypothetical protein